MEHLSELPDFRRGQGRRHSAATVVAVTLLAKLAGHDTLLAAARFAASLDQHEPEALGAWRNRRTGHFEPPSTATLYRFMQNTDPAGLEAAVGAWTASRLQGGRGIAADGKRIRGANRNGGCGRWETVSLVEHGSMMPYAVLGVREGGGEGGGGGAAVRAALEAVPLAGRMLTFDALHTNADIARLVVEAHGADWMTAVKGDTPEHLEAIGEIDWGATRRPAGAGRSSAGTDASSGAASRSSRPSRACSPSPM